MKRFTENASITEAVNALWAAFGTTQRGSVVSWEAIEAVMGHPHGDHPGKYIVLKFCRRLQGELDTVTLKERGVGIRFLTEQEVLQLIPLLRGRKAYRQMGRAVKELRTIDSGKLTDHEQHLLVVQLRDMAQKRSEHRAAVKNHSQIYAPSAVPPRPHARG